MYIVLSSPLKRTRLLLMFKEALDVVNVLVVRLLLDIASIVAVLIVIAPDAVSVFTDMALNILFDKPIIR